MKVLFDHQIFSLQRFGGISRYFANIFYGLKQSSKEQSSISVLYSQNHYIKDNPGFFGEAIGKLLFKTQKKIYKWNKKFSKYKIRKNNFDVFHPTYYEPYFLKYLKKPFVITVHDMIHERFPHYYSADDVLASHKKICIENADHIIAISHATKNDILEYFDIPENKITVIHHGFQPFAARKQDVVIVEEQYLLFVGERGLYKNFNNFIKAVTPSLIKNKNLIVFCAGGGAFSGKEMMFLIESGVQHQVIQKSVNDEILLSLYRNAIAFVFPSLYEGFGLPLLEAFYYDCPVVASNTSCFEEVCGNAALYFDPNSVESMRIQLEKIINDESLADDLRLKGKLRLNFFSIEKSVSSTINVYRKFANYEYVSS
ncbi:glycosyltransferase family 4 protein [Pedobacter sp. MW01-1-1]|uniref:glycosyltransferase family 4 protein n=1 Tax=Pedobacter sp. MW01-1-1 TaxID=3383027 RepID=UPI003FF0A8D2